MWRTSDTWTTTLLEGWIFEGLRKAVMELRECDAAAADATLTQLDSLDTQQVYDVIQGWAGERVLVDKTPPYVWSLDTLRRAEAVFEDVRYVFIHRHPYSNVASMAKETIRREWLSGALDGLMGTGPGADTTAAAAASGAAAAGAAGAAGGIEAGAVFGAGGVGGGGGIDTAALDASRARLAKARAAKAATQASIERALWDEAEHLWALGNANALDFLQEVPSERTLQLSFEELVTAPEASARALCDTTALDVGVPYCADMASPYTERNMASFAPAEAGGLGAGDPHMLTRRGIDPTLADAWRKASPPAPLSPFAAHVAKRLGYRLPMWKEPSVRVGTTPDVVRLNSRVDGPAVMIFVHDASGEAHAARPLAAKLSCPAFGIRATPIRGGDGGNGGDDGDALDRDGGVMMPDADIPTLATRYRSTAHKALGLTAGDRVLYAGAGPLGARVAFEMAAQQQRACATAAAAAAAAAPSSPPSSSSSSSASALGAANRTWDASCLTPGEPEPAGLLLLDGTVCGKPQLPLPPDIYALFAVARDETNAAAADEAEAAAAAFVEEDSSAGEQRQTGGIGAPGARAGAAVTHAITTDADADTDAADVMMSALTAASFGEGLRASGGYASAEAALDYAGSFRRTTTTTTGCAAVDEGEGGAVVQAQAGERGGGGDGNGGDDDDVEDKTLVVAEEGAGSGSAMETPQREWDQRVDRALRTTRRGLWLSGKYAASASGAASAAALQGGAAATHSAPSPSFDGLTLLVTAPPAPPAAPAPDGGAKMKEVEEEKEEDVGSSSGELAARCPRLRSASRPTWGDPFAPAHAADLAALIADELLPKKPSSSTRKKD